MAQAFEILETAEEARTAWWERAVSLHKQPPAYQRVLDLAGSALLLMLFAPLFGVVALLVKVTSAGPILFRQERLGAAGRRFMCLKFRTMHANVDSAPHREYFRRYMEGQAAPGEPTNLFKLRNDSRITPVGRVLRRLGLDELPQLINVTMGDMSLVGPRPPLEYEVEHYSLRHLRRLSVKPGITGLWQIRGRDVVDFETMVDMDIEYIENQSLWLDLIILFRTVPSLLWAFVRH
ncbi:MAG TPA: sugar transferase [Chloroflexota bacterium]|nr:sugar transferase [Chloroflexota bacterium]